MNIKSMRIKSHRSFAVDEAPLPPAAAERLRKLNEYDGLRANGCAGAAALRHAGLSRRTLRRRKYPFTGKARIHAMPARKGSRLGVSTVGRIIERALARGVIRRASLCEGRLRPRRRRFFNNWARRWRCGARAGSPGELVRIDHMTHSRDGKALKAFRAIRPATKLMVSRVRSQAAARSARRLLDEALAAFPFAVSSVQVDGGGGFMAEFEDAWPGPRCRPRRWRTPPTPRSDADGRPDAPSRCRRRPSLAHDRSCLSSPAPVMRALMLPHPFRTCGRTLAIQLGNGPRRPSRQ